MDTPQKRINHSRAVKAMEKTATKTVDFTIGILRWIFVLILIYFSIVAIIVYMTEGVEFLINIATLSVGGFFAFLFGYFGWRLGQSIEEYYKHLKEDSEK